MLFLNEENVESGYKNINKTCGPKLFVYSFYHLLFSAKKHERIYLAWAYLEQVFQILTLSMAGEGG